MSDKEFEEWKTKNYYYIQRDTRSQSHFSFENALKWLKIAWQEAAGRATEAERKLIVISPMDIYSALMNAKDSDFQRYMLGRGGATFKLFLANHIAKEIVDRLEGK